MIHNYQKVETILNGLQYVDEQGKLVAMQWSVRNDNEYLMQSLRQVNLKHIMLVKITMIKCWMLLHPCVWDLGNCTASETSSCKALVMGSRVWMQRSYRLHSLCVSFFHCRILQNSWNCIPKKLTLGKFFKHSVFRVSLIILALAQSFWTRYFIPW